MSDDAIDKFGTIFTCFNYTPNIDVFTAACDYSVSVGLLRAGLFAPYPRDPPIGLRSCRRFCFVFRLFCGIGLFYLGIIVECILCF
jgi:hypothetical protein